VKESFFRGSPLEQFLAFLSIEYFFPRKTYRKDDKDKLVDSERKKIPVHRQGCSFSREKDGKLGT